MILTLLILSVLSMCVRERERARERERELLFYGASTAKVISARMR